MAQDPNKVIRTPGFSSGSMALSSPSDAELLRQQIADTRAGMTDTLDAIQDRVSPRNIVHRATQSMKESIRESTVGQMKNLKNVAEMAGRTAGVLVARSAKPRERMMRVTRQNPVPAAVVGAALAWFVVRAFRNGRRRRGHDYLYEDAAL